MLVIDWDAHRTRTLANMRWGVASARRAWLTAEQVANTRPWAELARLRREVGGSSSRATTASRASRANGPRASRARSA